MIFLVLIALSGLIAFVLWLVAPIAQQVDRGIDRWGRD